MGWHYDDLDMVEGLVDEMKSRDLTIVDNSANIVMNKEVAQWCYDQLKEVQHGYIYTVAEALKRAIEG
jgi:hypothetical protein